MPVVFDLKDWFPDSAAAYFKNRCIAQCIRKGVWEITRRNLARSNRITTVSPSLVDKLKRLGFSADLITNGVNTELFVPQDGSETRRELGIGTDDFVIGFSGSIERWYAIDEMIRALPSLIRYRKNTRLLVVGGSLFTDYEQELRGLAGNLGVADHVMFTGHKTICGTPTVHRMYGHLHNPLSPPQWGDIALPNKFFEYSACGKPIVMRPIPDVTRIGGPNLFVYRTRDEFVAQVKTLMDNPATFHINLEKYSWKEKARQFEKLLGIYSNFCYIQIY